MRFIIVVVIVTGFFAIYKSKYGETKSNNTFINTKKVPHRPIKMTLNEPHRRYRHHGQTQEESDDDDLYHCRVFFLPKYNPPDKVMM